MTPSWRQRNSCSNVSVRKCGFINRMSRWTGLVGPQEESGVEQVSLEEWSAHGCGLCVEEGNKKQTGL